MVIEAGMMYASPVVHFVGPTGVIIEDGCARIPTAEVLPFQVHQACRRARSLTDVTAPPFPGRSIELCNEAAKERV